MSVFGLFFVSGLLSVSGVSVGINLKRAVLAGRHATNIFSHTNLFHRMTFSDVYYLSE